MSDDRGLDGDTTLPMFPLGSVLFPAMPLPLQVFEPRYARLLSDCLEGDMRFGVVLIERGSEVGGGDVRSDLGTMARLVTVSTIAPDRYAAMAVGEQVIDVVEWLPDDPYPRAVVRPRHDTGGPVPDDLVEVVTARFRRVLALHSEFVGGAVPATVELADDAAARSFQIAAMAPLGPFDRQRLLAAASPSDRLALAADLLEAHEELLRADVAVTGDDAGERGDDTAG